MKRKIAFFSLGAISLVISYYFFPEKPLDNSKKIDSIIVYKSLRQMDLMSGKEFVKSYKISLGDNPIGHKQFEGDEKTPEGIYHLFKRKTSIAYKSIWIDYPNKRDCEFAQNTGKSPGGSICIHGLLNGRGFVGKFHRWKDWTNGCIAVTNEEMDEIYNAIDDGLSIEIHP